MVLIILIIGNVFNYLITYYTAANKLADNRSRWLKALTIKGRVYIILAFFASCISVGQYFLLDMENKAEQDKRDGKNNLKHKQAIDSLKLSYDSSTVRIIKYYDSSKTEITNSLIRYNLHYDDEQKEIKKIVRDSLKTIIIQTETPTLIVQGNGLGISFDSLKNEYFIKMASKNATSRNINLKSSVVFLRDSNYYYWGEVTFFRNTTITKEHVKSLSLNKEFVLNNIKNKELIIWLRGSYYNNDLSEDFLFDEMIVYYFDARDCKTLENETKEYISNFINKNESLPFQHKR